MNEIRETMLHGLRPRRTFRFAATKYLQDYAQQKSIGDAAGQLKMLDPMIGDLDLRQVHMGSLQGSIAKRKAEGVKTKTLNAALAVVRRILNLAASEWIDEKGLTWLETAPKIKLFSVKDASTHTGGAVALVSRAARLPGAHGAVQGEHGVAANRRGLSPALGL